MASFLLTLGVDTTMFILKGVYSTGRWLIYGHEKTQDEQIADILNEYKVQNTELNNTVKELRHECIELKKLYYKRNGGNEGNEEVYQSSGSEICS